MHEMTCATTGRTRMEIIQPREQQQRCKGKLGSLPFTAAGSDLELVYGKSQNGD